MVKKVSLSEPYIYIPVLVSLFIFLFSILGLITLAKFFLTRGTCTLDKTTKKITCNKSVTAITNFDLLSVRFLILGFVLNALLPIVFYLLPAISSGVKALPRTLGE